MERVDTYLKKGAGLWVKLIKSEVLKKFWSFLKILKNRTGQALLKILFIFSHCLGLYAHVPFAMV